MKDYENASVWVKRLWIFRVKKKTTRTRLIARANPNLWVNIFFKFPISLYKLRNHCTLLTWNHTILDPVMKVVRAKEFFRIICRWESCTELDFFPKTLEYFKIFKSQLLSSLARTEPAQSFCPHFLDAQCNPVWNMPGFVQQNV